MTAKEIQVWADDMRIHSDDIEEKVAYLDLSIAASRLEILRLTREIEEMK